MTARLRKLLSDLSETFWLVPGATVLLGIVAGFALLAIDQSGSISKGLLDGP